MSANDSKQIAFGLVVSFLIVESISLFLNGLVLYLISKQGLKQIDRWLAVFVASADIFLALYKTSVYVYLLSDPNQLSTLSLLKMANFGQFDGFIHQVLLTISGMGIAYLALIRYWVIVQRRKIVIWKWLTVLGFKILFCLIIQALTAFNYDYELFSPSNYYLISLTSTKVSTNLALISTTVYEYFILLSINFSYFFIALKYYGQIASLRCTTDSISAAAYETFSFKNARLRVIVKITVIMFVYNFLILPALIVSTVELATRQRRGKTADYIQGSLLLLSTLFNPIILIFLHSETWNEAKRIYKDVRGVVITSKQIPLPDTYSSNSSLYLNT